MLRVAMVGFSPGFAYLSGLPEQLRDVPRALDRARRSRGIVGPGERVRRGLSPRPRAVGNSSAGAGLPLFTPEVPPSPGSRPGTRCSSSAQRRATRCRRRRPASRPIPLLCPVHIPFVVEDGGLRTVLQDAGRRTSAALGVPSAGPADPSWFELANRLVGNADDAGTLEVTARGPVLRCIESTFVAVVGESPDLRLQGQPVEPGRVFPVSAGQQVALRTARGGLVPDIAVAGGLLGPRVLGSMSTDQLSGVGPGPIAAGRSCGRPP